MFKRKNKAETDALLTKLGAMNKKGGGKFESDGTEWTLTKDAAGNGAAIIRFLPAKDVNGEDIPFVKMMSHGVKNNGQWYIENCPTLINEKCPVCDANSELWNSGIESNKKIASDRKRKTRFIGNIVVLQDKANPEAEGKVFKYSFGSKIMAKIVAMGNPEFDGQAKVDVTDVFDGAPFYLKAEKVSGQTNYDKSTFGTPCELFDGDTKKLNAVHEAMHALKPLVAADQFKSYEELETKWNRVNGKTAKNVQRARQEDLSDLSQVDTTDDIPFDMPDAPSVSGDADDLDDFFASLDQ